MEDIKIKLWVDFNNSSKSGVRLNCQGTIDGLTAQKVELVDGTKLIIWDHALDDNNEIVNLIVEATARYNIEDNIWEAIFDWADIKHESEMKKH